MCALARLVDLGFYFFTYGFQLGVMGLQMSKLIYCYIGFNRIHAKYTCAIWSFLCALYYYMIKLCIIYIYEFLAVFHNLMCCIHPET